MGRLGRASELRRVTFAVVVLVCASIGGSCGGESGGLVERIQTELDETRNAFEAGDIAEVCIRMATPRCVPTIRFLLERGHPSTSAARSGERTVVAVDGRHQADAIVTLNDRVPGRLRFVERNGEWKLRDVALKPLEDHSRWSSVTNNQVESFRAARMRGSRRIPCPPITKIAHSGDIAVRGGCRFRVASSGMAILMLTAFGDFEIARCATSHVLHIASNSTGILADRIRFQGSGLCPRIRHCQDRETGLRYPWQGSKLHGHFRPPLHMQLDICVNTPMGRARGMFHFRLTRNGNEHSWTATPYDYPIGESSVQFSGTSKLEPGGLELRPAGF